MGKHQRAIFYQYSIIVSLALVALVALVAWPMAALAQSGCVGDPCVFYTPTATGTPSPAPTPLTGTATAVAMPSAVPFPDPDYGQPTSLPALQFSDVPNAIQPTINPMPSPLALATLAPPVTGSSAVELSEINTTINLSYTTPLTLSGGISSSLTGTQIYSTFNGMIGAGQGVISDVASYTTYISGEINKLQYTETITITTAPTWYAPYMPREFADVGWTFELMDSRMYSVSRISLNSWATLFGYMSALPFRLIKNIWELFRFLGPFGLFLIWLLAVMLPAVFGFRLLMFLKTLVIRVFNFILWVIDWILKLWEAIPFVN